MDRVTAVRRLAELWTSNGRCDGDAIGQACELTEALCARDRVPTGMLSAAWRLVARMHERAGRPAPEDGAMARARSAAVSARHACSLLLAELDEVLERARRPVVVFSELALCQTLFGRWDVVPPRGALVVSLAGDPDEGVAGAAIPVQEAIRWGSAGRLAPFLEEGRREVSIEGCEFDLPPLEALVPRLAAPAADGSEVDAFLLAAAARRCGAEGRWRAALGAAAASECSGALRRAVSRWRLEDGNGVKMPGSTVVKMARRMFAR